ncbi:MAG: hypothetical protein HZB53_10475 [Chloroflexi bacterium]|nr:hypothetical protein [Chloroflexota bacterium]
MPSPTDFDPDQVAYFEKAGWEAYYARNWPRAFMLLVQLNRAQFRMNWLDALAAALDTVRASIAFAPLDRSDVLKATQFIERFYARARRTLGLKADAATLARLEMDYWVVHRQLAIARARNPQDGDIGPMVESLVRLHAALFEVDEARVRTSAELRARAAEVVDLITSHRSTDVPGDWRRVEDYLQRAYRAVKGPATPATR